MLLCKRIEQPEAALNTKLACTPLFLTTGRLNGSDSGAADGDPPSCTRVWDGWMVSHRSDKRPLIRGQFLELLIAAAPCSSTGEKERETARSNLKISCCSHTRSIPLLPVPWCGVHSLCRGAAGPGQAGQWQKQSARPCALPATTSKNSVLSSGSGVELNTHTGAWTFVLESSGVTAAHCTSTSQPGPVGPAQTPADAMSHTV